jgi:dinuclear metal center YbgI/SA1388 family protein
MLMKLHDVLDTLELFAPTHLAHLGDDTNGLQIAGNKKNIKKILITLDVTEQAIEKAVKNKCELIISHHPLIYAPLTEINDTTPLGRKIKLLLKNNITLFVAHTNLDAAPFGINYWLALKEGLEPANCEVIAETYQEELLKLTVFVPKKYADKVRRAISDAGAGYIGNYSHCTFNIEGEGTFKPLDGSDPCIGKKGILETVSEIRIETIIEKSFQPDIIEAMLAAHPYEEVAYDLYPLANQGKKYGLGLVGKLKKARSLNGKKIKTLAICGGSGGKLIQRAKDMGADAFILGECSYHDELLAKEIGLLLIKKGHFETENAAIKPMAKLLTNLLPSDLEILTN